MRLGVMGAGRLGRLVAQAAQSDERVELAWTIGRDADLTTLTPVDVAIDVSHPDAVAAHLAWARRTGTDLVLGVTGWSRDLLATADASAAPTGGIGILLAPNFSLSVALLRRMTAVLGRYAASADAPVDLAVHERHHRHKVDAPSGTAVLLADALRASQGSAGASSSGADVQVSSQRVGEVVGFHEVRYQSPSESLVLSHEAHRREVFADGALVAARWIHDRPGVHTFDDLADDLLAPLFTPIFAPAAPSSPTAAPALTH